MALPETVVAFLSRPGAARAAAPWVFVITADRAMRRVELSEGARRYVAALAVPAGLRRDCEPAPVPGASLDATIRVGGTQWSSADLVAAMSRSGPTLSRADAELRKGLAASGVDPAALVHRSKNSYALAAGTVDVLVVLQLAVREDWGGIAAFLRGLDLEPRDVVPMMGDDWHDVAIEAVDDALRETARWADVHEDAQGAERVHGRDAPLALGGRGGPEADPAGTAGPAGTANVRRTRRPMAALGVALGIGGLVAAGAFALSVGADDQNAWTREESVIVDNRVTAGPTLKEDSKAVPLTSKPRVYCGDAGCVIPGTARRSGATYDHVVCQTTGDRTTNGHDGDPADDTNPGLVESRRYYGVRRENGSLGFVSEVWLAAPDRGGKGLPRC